MSLEDLLVDLSGLSDEEAERKGLEMYESIYMQRGKTGLLTDPIGETVIFHLDRYGHAFRTSSDRVRRPYAKDKVDRSRIERIKWIKELIEGRVPGSACYHVRPEGGRLDPPDRLVITLENRFIVWLWPTRSGAWKFSSAYTTTENDIYRYKRRSIRCVWSVPEEKEKPRD